MTCEVAAAYAIAVDRIIHDRARDLDASERAAVLATVDRRGELSICRACDGSGWAPGTGETPRRHAPCAPCRGFGAVPA